jgi:catalase
VNYEPNTLATGSEQRVDGGTGGFQSYPEELESPKIRRRSASFDDHFSQATLFWNSQSPAEKDHIVAAFQFELSKVQVPAIRQRVVDNLAHVDAKLARKVAEPLGIGAPDAKAAAGRAGFREARIKLPIESSPALSMETSGGGIQTRKVAILVADGVETGAMKIVQQALLDAGAVCKIVGPHLGFVSTSSGQQLAVDFTYVNMPSVMFDAVLVPSGAISAKALVGNGDAVHFVLEAYKHFKTVCVIGEGVELLRSLGITGPESAAVAGVLVGKSEPTARVQLAQDFVAAIGKHRHWSRANVDAVPA